MLNNRTDADFYNVTFDLTPRVDSLPVAASEPRQPTSQQIQRMQEYLATLPQIPNEPIHHFADGMYGRELPIQADAYVVGKIHRHEHIVLLIKGEATINTDRGMERISAPHIWISQPGAKRALYTHTDCVFFTCHLNPDNTQDLEAIEDYVIVPEPQLKCDRPELSEFANELQGVYA